MTKSFPANLAVSPVGADQKPPARRGRKPAADAADGEAQSKPVGAALAAVRILRFLAAAQGPLGVTAIARALDLYPGTCFNLLKTLHREQLVAFDPHTKTYSLGFRVLELAHGLLRSVGYLDTVRPALRRISESYLVTSYLLKVDGHDRTVFIDAVGPGTAMDVQVSAGRRLSPYQGAMGRLVAAIRGESVDDIRDHLDRIPWQNRPSDEQFAREIDEARLRGYGVDRDSMVRGLSSVAVPVLNPDGALTLILSSIGLSQDLPPKRLKELAEEQIKVAGSISALAAMMRD